MSWLDYDVKYDCAHGFLIKVAAKAKINNQDGKLKF